MPTEPVDLVNRALDECGQEEIGDLTEGCKAARVATRLYTPTLRQLLAGAPWNFARKQLSLVALADVNGILASVTAVPNPWTYMYDWPTDCVHARFVYATDNLGNVAGAWASPAPFLVSNAPWPNDPAGNWGDIEGHDPESTRVILTNQSSAQLVYTGLMQYPDAWDPLFEQAFVAALAARFAFPLIDDKALARQVRNENVALARGALDAARVRDGDEGWTVADHTPDWIRARTSGVAWGGPSCYYPWASVPWLEDAGGVY